MIAGIVGLIRYKLIDDVYKFFIVYIWLGVINECISYILISNGTQTTLNGNIYILFSSLMLILFFNKQNLFYKYQVIGLIIFLTIAWVIDTFFIGNIHEISSYYRIISALTMIFLSTNTVNNLLLSAQTSVKANPVFIISISLIIYFIFKALIEAFWIYGTKSSFEFLKILYTIMVYITLLSNIIYVIVLLWIPKKQPSLLPS